MPNMTKEKLSDEALSLIYPVAARVIDDVISKTSPDDPFVRLEDVHSVRIRTFNALSDAILDASYWEDVLNSRSQIVTNRYLRQAITLEAERQKGVGRKDVASVLMGIPGSLEILGRKKA